MEQNYFISKEELYICLFVAIKRNVLFTFLLCTYKKLKWINSRRKETGVGRSQLLFKAQF